MKFRTQLLIWYSGALLAAFLVLVVHGLYEVYEHTHKEALDDHTEATEVLLVELAVGLPLMAMGITLTWLMSRRMLAKLEMLTEAAAGLHAGNLEVNLPPAAPVRNELDRLVEVFRDMTVRLRDSFAQTRDFTLNASHELKTPLAIMRGEVEMELAEEGNDSRKTAWMESLLEEIDRLARVVDGLTFLAKVDAGQVPLREEMVDLSELVNDAVEDASLLAGPHGLTVEGQVPDEPCFIQGDRHRLRQLLLNLVDNAVKYNQKDGFVRIVMIPEGGGVSLEISNPGAAIPQELEGRVFERFFRYEAKTEGSGLGLHICQWIVRRHGGDIALATGPDGVTHARVWLPWRNPAGS
jgi:signal transduction histidine kinase